MTSKHRFSKNSLVTTYRDGLLDNVIPFWIEHAVDHEFGGFMTSVDRDGTIIDTDKGVWQQGRFTWLLGELYNNVEPRREWLELATHGARFLDQHCYDPIDGRMWFHVDQRGRPIRKRRYAFSESFAAIAYGELAKATGDDGYVEKARRAFERFIEHNLSPQNCEPKFTETRPTRSLGFPMITIATAQELRESIGLLEAEEWIDRSIETIRKYHWKPELPCLMETVGLSGEVIEHFLERTLNPGHALEAAWFMLLEGKVREDRELVEFGCQILDCMWERGWDKTHGGVLYFVDLKGLPVQEYWHDMKFWWPHNEAILATLLAYLLTGDAKYMDWHGAVHRWAHEHFADTQLGEWYGYLHRDGRLSSTLKGNLWKGPFHLPRMQLNCWKWLEELG